MKTIQSKLANLVPVALLALLSTLNSQVSTLRAQGTAFTYQGLLEASDSPVTGPYDMTFTLFSVESGPGQVGTPSPVLLVGVTNGLFTVTLDFGAGIFTGPPRWLEIAVRANGSGNPLTPLAQRAALTASPYAIMAGNAGSLGGQLPAAFAPASGSSAYVAKAGDTMTGDLVVQGQVSGDGSYFGSGVHGISGSISVNLAGIGVWGENSDLGIGVKGTSYNGWAVFGQSQHNHGVFGETFGNAYAGVLGMNASPTGANGQGVYGYAASGAVGVLGISEGGDGISGRSNGDGKSGVFGWSTRAAGFGGYFYNSAGGQALHTDGDAFIDGSATVKCLTINGGCDLAEPFEVSPEVTAEGAVVVIDEANPGKLKLSDRAYDTRVAGIVSGANGVKPGIALHQAGVFEGGKNVALTGRVYVLADASGAPIKPGDLLTTSPTPGHAMKASDHLRAQGAILGKAMTGLSEGRGPVLVLVTLQ